MDDPKVADRHHWTAVALCGWLKEKKELVMSYRTLVRYRHEQNYARRIRLGDEGFNPQLFALFFEKFLLNDELADFARRDARIEFFSSFV